MPQQYRMEKDQLRTLFQMGSDGGMADAAKVQATQVSPPATGGPPPPTKPSAKREVDNPNQYGKPPVLGPPKGNMKTPAFEDIVAQIKNVAENGVDPYDAVENLFYDKPSEDDENANEDDDDAETSGGSLKEGAKVTTADGQGADSNSPPALAQAATGQSIGTAPIPSIGGPPKGDVTFTPASPSYTNSKDFHTEVKGWLEGVPTNKKVWVGGLFMHKNGPNEFYVDGITKGTVSLEVAALAAVKFGGFLAAPKSEVLP